MSGLSVLSAFLPAERTELPAEETRKKPEGKRTVFGRFSAVRGAILAFFRAVSSALKRQERKRQDMTLRTATPATARRWW